MHMVRGQPEPTPCSSSGLGPMIMASPQPGSTVTVLVSDSVWGRYDRIFGFGATPPRHYGSPFGQACSLLVLLCVPQHPTSGCLGAWVMWVPSVIPRLWDAFSERARGHTTPKSGRAPGPSAGPGSFSVPELLRFPPSELPRSSSSGDICGVCRVHACIMWVNPSPPGRLSPPPVSPYLWGACLTLPLGGMSHPTCPPAFLRSTWFKCLRQSAAAATPVVGDSRWWGRRWWRDKGT